MVTSGSQRLKHMTLHHPEHIQIARQKTLTVPRVPQRFEPTQCREFNTYIVSFGDLDVFHNIEHVENNTDSESQPRPSTLPWKELYPGAGAPLIGCIAEPWERDSLSWLETNPQNNPYYPFATREDYKYIRCGMKMTSIKTY
jgi:hypothetical protein